MLFTASTVKDTLPNVQRFVAGNLAGGVDHMFVLLDAPDAEGQAEVGEWLDEHPHVTCIRTDRTWWAGKRPGQLNVRQRINANALKHVLADVDGAEWLFHIDGDEVVQLDRSVLAEVPADSPVVRLAPLEAVSRVHWDEPPTWFKRLLGDEDLVLLHTLGVIDRPRNGNYFHGHVEGKSGARPGAREVRLTLHKAVADGRQLPSYRHDALRVLHYESWSGEDFVRKWSAMVGSGPSPNFRPARDATAVAVRALIGKDLDRERAEEYLLRIFRRTTEDDFETLRDLGLLEHVDPREGRHRPAGLTADQRSRLDRALAALHPEPKRHFHPGPEPGEEDATGRGDRAPADPSADPPGPATRAVRSLLRRS